MFNGDNLPYNRTKGRGEGMSYDDNIRQQLEQVTEAILDRMQSGGWYWGASRAPRFDRPTPRDINNGECEQWAILAIAAVGGRECWLDTFSTTQNWPHCVLRLNGKYYDSLHLDGCRTLRQFVTEARLAAKAYEAVEALRTIAA